MDVQQGKHLTFSLGKEDYGIPILKVKEIIGMMEITEVPKTPVFMKGVINLRGKIIPIIDLRLKFGMQEKSYNERTCIIVVEITLNTSKSYIGLVVDIVSEVVTIQDSEIEPPPEYGTTVESSFLTGMGKVKDKVIMLLNINEILEMNELKTIVNNRTESQISA